MTSVHVMNQRHQPADSLDYFPTPPWATRAMLHEVLIPRQNFWFPIAEMTALNRYDNCRRKKLPVSDRIRQQYSIAWRELYGFARREKEIARRQADKAGA